MRTHCVRLCVYLILVVVARQTDALAQGASDVVWEGRSHSGYAGTLAFSPDGQIVATGTDAHLSTIPTRASLSSREREP